ncbi:MAG: putative membrane protein [Parcubacteria bacterium C7867-007]|nr:MAG: putative membrane protein [Parcubacteria bacterium C7867-007]
MYLKVLAGLVAFIIFASLLVVIFQQPRTDRTWSEEFSRTVVATNTSRDTILISNVRDWTYEGSSIVSKDWRTVEVDPNSITKVWFITEPFSDWKAVGHTFLTFEFKDGTALSFSIEARREQGEDYSAIRGLFNNYELANQWGTERDFISRRLIYLDHPVRRFPLSISSTTAEALFRGSIEQTNEVAAKPRFYNTLTENCTNALAHIVNDLAPGTLPYDISWNLTGYSDLYLMKEGFIEKVNDSKEDTRTAYDLTYKKAEIMEASTQSGKQFSAFLNTLAK